MLRFALMSIALLALTGMDVTSENWPQWRGPQFNGVSPSGDPPAEWSDTKNIKWKVPIPGRGHGTPIIWKDRIFILTAIKGAPAPAGDKQDSFDLGLGEGAGGADILAFSQDSQPREGRPREGGQRGGGQEGREGRPRGERRGPGQNKPTDVHKFAVLALDRANGKTIWERIVKEEVPHEGTHADGTFASASAITDGTHVYAFFGSRGLHCLDWDGKIVWSKEFGQMRTRNSFGEGASPALHGDTLVVVWDHQGDDFVAALDKKTGDIRWKKERDEDTAWATPLIVEHGGRTQAIISATKRVRSYDLKTGEQIWECGGMTGNVIPTPVRFEDTVIVISGFRGAATRAIKLAVAKGDITDSKEAIAWRYDEDTPYVPSPLLYGDCLYFLKNNNAQLTCLNAKTGEKNFGPQRLDGLKNIYASIVGAGDRVYIADREGNTLVLKRGKEFNVIGLNQMNDGFDASPAIVGKELYLRGKEHLYCIASQ